MKGGWNIQLLKNNNEGGKIIEVKNGGSACKMPSNKNQELLLWGAKNKIKYYHYCYRIFWKIQNPAFCNKLTRAE